MTKPSTPEFIASSERSALSDTETEALNWHGVFFKKRVIKELQEISGIRVMSEEFGVSFGETRVIDILATAPGVLFNIECKRAFTAQKCWIFFRDFDPRYRVLRVASACMGTPSSVFRKTAPDEIAVCSEGFEYRAGDEEKKKRPDADQNPVFKAASQVAACHLGLIARRLREINGPGSSRSDFVERYVPVLVTNAELVVVDQDLPQIQLASGRVDANPKAKSVDYLVLKQPFPSPSALGNLDFRHNPNSIPDVEPAYWTHQTTESIYVVRSTALGGFFGKEQRELFETIQHDD